MRKFTSQALNLLRSKFKIIQVDFEAKLKKSNIKQVQPYLLLKNSVVFTVGFGTLIRD